MLSHLIYGVTVALGLRAYIRIGRITICPTYQKSDAT